MILRNRPWLVNANGKYTIHEYCGSEVLTLRDNTEYQVTGVAHMFRCTETSVIRRYGFEGGEKYA